MIPLTKEQSEVINILQDIRRVRSGISTSSSVATAIDAAHDMILEALALQVSKMLINGNSLKKGQDDR